MSEQLSTLMILTGTGLLVLFLWVLSVLIVRWDVRRRNLTGFESYIWPILTALLPLFGFIAYLFARFALPSSSQQLPGKRVTLSQRPSEPGRRLPTIVATDLRPGTIGEARASVTPAAYGDRTSNVLQGVPTLIVTEGPYTGKEFILDQLPARVGRGTGAAIRLDEDLGVSRQHAEFYRLEGRLHIRDLNSTHGTQVNGLVIADGALKPGDQIQIGFTRLLVQEEKR